MSNVKSYTDKQLIDRMKSLPSYLYVPKGMHIIVVRSEEDAPDKYDDKLYLFKGEKCMDVMSCTSNSGLYGLRYWAKWSKFGTAVIKFDEIYYNSFQKTDGKKIRHHKGKMQALRQIAPLKYYRDSNKDNKIDETGRIHEGINHTNVHTNSYKHKKGIRSWIIGKWGTGCTVVNDLTKYWEVLMVKITYNEPVTYTGLKEF
jgi:hypothetical protein